MASEFDLGDRISFYGGEGTVIEESDSSLSVLTDDGDVREFSKSMPLLSRISSDSNGLTTFLGGEAKVISVSEHSSGPDLVAICTNSGEFKKIPADTEALSPGTPISKRLTDGLYDDPIRFSLRERAARMNLAYRSDRFLSLSGNRIRIEPYQVDAAHKILNAHKPRFLIADEVGLGKTIEAGIILEELIARGRADRVLIVTPASLRDQWQREMREKFGREYVTYDRDYVDVLNRKHVGENVWTQENRIVVSIDFVKQDDLLRQLRDLKKPWDAVVVDEAHHLTARDDGDGVSRTDRYHVGEAIAENSNALLFLTGTPHKGKPHQFYHLLKLLDPYRFNGPEDITPDRLEDLMIRRLKTGDSMVDSEGKPMFPERKILTRSVELSRQERDIYEDITEYISALYTTSGEVGGHAAGFRMVIYQKRLVSSFQAISESLRRRRDDDGRDTAVPASVTEKMHSVEDSAETEEEVLQQLVDAASGIGVDSKGKNLREFITGVLDESPGEKVLVFTEYTDTLEYLSDEVLHDLQTVQIRGGMGHDTRREAIKDFEDDASVLLATDAAREGLNLQFAHIMVNYDLPWNPIRIDQRMGRLHRYGQEETVQIHNLFVEDTRESKILKLLINKIDRIESDLGMRSEVLGAVDEDIDVEDAIMDAVSGQRNTDDVQRDIDQAMEDRQEAVERIEQEFLIRDKFDASDHRKIRSLIDLSEDAPINENDIEQIVRQFCKEFGGSFQVVRHSKDADAPLYSVTLPDVLCLNSPVESQYSPVTFSRSVALEEQNAELVSLNHTLIQEIVEYCLDGDWIDGQATCLVTNETDVTPGVLATYRLGYVSGEGEIPTEDYVRVYVDSSGSVCDEVPETVGAIPSHLAALQHTPSTRVDDVPGALDTAKGQGHSTVDELAEEVREERERDVEIQEKHARRYFQQEIREYEDQLAEHRQEARDTDKDMTIRIRKSEKELKEKEAEWEAEKSRLEREREVIPDEPELVNAANVVSQVPAVMTRDDPDSRVLADAIKGPSKDRITFLPFHSDCPDASAVAASPARLIRSEKLVELVQDLTRVEIGGTQVAVHPDRQQSPRSQTDLAGLRSRLQTVVDEVSSGITAGLCYTDRPLDAVSVDDWILFNSRISSDTTISFWRVVAAREAVIGDRTVPPEQLVGEVSDRLDS